MQLQVGVKALIRQDTRYLFLRRSPSFNAGPQKWDIPGGRIDPGEVLHDALAREVREETGLKIETVDMLLAAQDILVVNQDLHVVRLTYFATASGTVTISDEHDDYKWMSVEEILIEPHVDSYLREVLETIRGDNG